MRGRTSAGGVEAMVGLGTVQHPRRVSDTTTSTEGSNGGATLGGGFPRHRETSRAGPSDALGCGLSASLGPVPSGLLPAVEQVSGLRCLVLLQKPVLDEPVDGRLH